jgi:hypothetical protein
MASPDCRIKRCLFFPSFYPISETNATDATDAKTGKKDNSRSLAPRA